MGEKPDIAIRQLEPITRPAHPLDRAAPQLRTYGLSDLIDRLFWRSGLSSKTIGKSTGRPRRDDKNKHDHSTLESIGAGEIADPQVLGGVGKLASVGPRRTPIAGAKLQGRQSPGQAGRSGRRHTKHGSAQAEENNDPSLLFDTAWYISRYPDVARAGVDPLEHYLTSGAAEGRDPCALFDTDWYVSLHPEAALNPLAHYISVGGTEGYDPSPLFDADWYVSRYPEVAESGLNPLAHYLLVGTDRRYDPSPLFDTAWYVSRYPGVAKSGLSPLAHYLLVGAASGCDPSPLFDTAWYLSRYQEVAKRGLNPLAHYLYWGAAGGNDPSPLFDAKWYASRYPEVAESGLSPLAHYVSVGAAQGFDPSALFDSKWYVSRYPEAAESGLNPLAHYRQIGAASGCNPSPLFDTAWYVSRYPDVARAGVDPLEHYLSSGAAEGRDPCAMFDTAWYVSRYPEVAESGLNPLAHYLTVGAASGCDPSPQFDTAWYVSQHPEVVESGLNPLAHYLLVGAAKGYAAVRRVAAAATEATAAIRPMGPSASAASERDARQPPVAPQAEVAALFDPDYYRAAYSDLSGPDGDLLHHFLHWGISELRNPNALFDTRWYLEKYPDVADGGMTPLMHYIRHGAAEGRDPSPIFDSAFYVRQHTEAHTNPLLHYFQVGRSRNYPTIDRPEIADYMPSASTLFEPPEDLEVDVIIPVYRGLDETRACIESVLADDKRPNGRVIVIDDCSPERKLSSWLDRLAATGAIHLLRNSKNLGFVRTVNRGMAEAAGNDVVLLNSDTEVPAGWLYRMAGHAYAGERVGTVTPLSNNATLCSYPSFAGGPLPFNRNLAELDAAARTANAGRAIEIPTAVGFAMYIRRACLDEMGVFDAEKFGRGYGEENDFCVRASRSGWSHKLACDVFVYHAGEVSFGKDSPERSEAWSRLVKLHPDYPKLIAQHISSDPGAPFRFALTGSLFRQAQEPVTLLVSHALGGGVQRHINDLVPGTDDRRLYLLLTPSPRGVRLQALGAPDYPALELTPDRLPDLIEVLTGIGIDRVHIHHLLGLPISVRSLVEALDVPFDFTVHDYFSLCPQITMLQSLSKKYCGEPPPRACNACIAAGPSYGATDIFSWRRKYAWVFLDADRVICPDQDVLDRLRRFGLGSRAVLGPHEGSNRRTWVDRHRRLQPDEPLRVAVLGVLAPHKGLHLFEALVRATPPAIASFTIIGTAERPLSDDIRPRIVETGRYQEADLTGLIELHKPHVILFPGLWPETYSYTLSAVLKAGLPLISADIGAIASRTRGRPWTLHVDLSDDVYDWSKALRAMREALIDNTWPGPTEPPRRLPDFYPDSYLKPVTKRVRNAAKPVLLIPDRFPKGGPTPSGYVRLLLPYDDLAAAGLARIDLVDFDELPYIEGSAVICQRHVVADERSVVSLAELCKQRNMRLVYDLDDDLINIPAEHEEAKALRPLSLAVRRMVEVADLVTVSTPLLKDRLSHIRSDCSVQPNMLDERLWPRRPTARDRGAGPVRILYIGTTTHRADYAMIAPCFERLKARYGDRVEFDVIGVTTGELGPSVNRVVPPTNPAVVSWLPYQQRWDIGVAPLLDTPFNRVKSNIKLLEYTGLGLASIASNVIPYRGEMAEAGAVILVENNFADWIAGLSALIDSEELRRKIAAAADNFVRSNLTTAHGRDDRFRTLGRKRPSSGRSAARIAVRGDAHH